MSLLLRKACQEVLENNKLGDYHVRVDENYRTLQIVGPCGNPLFSISGIKFSKTAPNSEEIDFAEGLLNDFFAQHKADLNAYFKAEKVWANTEAPEFDLDISVSSVRNGWVSGNIAYKDKYNKSGKHHSFLSYEMENNTFTFNQNKGVDEKQLVAFASKNNTKRLKAACKKYKAYKEIETVFTDAKAKIQMCNI